MKINSTIRETGEQFLQDIAKQLLSWYEKEKRDLPWRETSDPYHVLVSEIMLQQTRVETVIPYYKHFLAAFPTLADLAAADEEEVLLLWTGLGYYRRARYLHATAREVQRNYGGRLPDTLEDLRKLPGIGRYTAAAIASIAYDKPHAAVDGNVLRIVARLIGIDLPIQSSRVFRTVERYVQQHIPHDRAGDFTQALMDFGSLICLPKKPLCGQCPLIDICVAFRDGRTDELPVRTKAAPPSEERRIVLVLLDGEKNVWLERRDEEGLLANMWQFPNRLVEDASDPYRLATEFAQQTATMLEAAVSSLQRLSPYSHRFSHRIWHVFPFAAVLTVQSKDVGRPVAASAAAEGGKIGYGHKPDSEAGEGDNPLRPDGVWQPLRQVNELPIPNAFLPLVKFCHRQVVTVDGSPYEVQTSLFVEPGRMTGTVREQSAP